MRRPDIAFLSSEQWARVDPDEIPVPFAPRLAIEVASSSDTVESLFVKVREYLDAGAHTVLVMLSEPFEEAHIFERSGARRLARPGETVELPELLPGLSIPVEEIFGS